jgi:hypothetical protein
LSKETFDLGDDLFGVVCGQLAGPSTPRERFEDRLGCRTTPVGRYRSGWLSNDDLGYFAAHSHDGAFFKFWSLLKSSKALVNAISDLVAGKIDKDRYGYRREQPSERQYRLMRDEIDDVIVIAVRNEERSVFENLMDRLGCVRKSTIVLHLRKPYSSTMGLRLVTR